MEPITSILVGIATKVLSTQANKLIDAGQKYFFGQSSSDQKKATNDSRLSKAELDYYQKKLEIDQKSLNLEIEIKREQLKLSQLRHELLREHQEKEIELKLQEIQAQWDINDTWFSKISRDETKQILKKYKEALLILASPISIAGDKILEPLRNLDFKIEMRTVGDFLSQYYSPQDELYPVKFFSDYFRQPIEGIGIERLHSLLSSVPIYIIYTDIRTNIVTFRVSSWKMQDDQAIPLPSIEWNWREVMAELLAKGQSEEEALYSIREIIIKIHKVLLAFYSDLYYLSIDPYYEIRLPEIDFEPELLEPYSKRLQALQGQIQKDYEQDLAQRLEESRGQKFFFEVVTLNRKGNITNRRQGSARQQVEDLGNRVSLEMVYIPGGTFMMGAPKTEKESNNNERPQHEVTVPSFYMGKYPITQAQWKIIAKLPKIERDLKPDPARFKGENRPVECVSWYDVVEFCKRLTKRIGKEYRLPSEAEWEYATRAGTNTPFYFGETLTTELANYDGNHTYAEESKGEYRKQTTPVGQFPPNAFGLYDLHGNVWEWCLDDWHENYEGAPKDGKAWINNDNHSRKCLRGGSWGSYPRFCRSADRYRYDPVNVGINYGFRVVLVGPGL